MLLPLVLIGGGAVWLYSLQNAAKNLSINVTQAAITGIQQGAVQMWADLTMDNFSDRGFTITQPLIKVFLGEVEIGNSIPTTATHTIAGKARTPVRVTLSIPLSNIPLIAPLLLSGQKADRLLKLKVFTQAEGIPYTTEKMVSI